MYSTEILVVYRVDVICRFHLLLQILHILQLLLQLFDSPLVVGFNDFSTVQDIFNLSEDFLYLLVKLVISLPRCNLFFFFLNWEITCAAFFSLISFAEVSASVIASAICFFRVIRLSYVALPLTGWICNAPDARSGAIKFTFKLDDRLYRVTRTRQKSGKATLNIAEFVEGEWVDRSKEKFKDTQQEIINIIGMDSLTLKACALIMQDQYGLFLQADKEARMNILGSILGLGIYADMETLAADKATETNRTNCTK